MVNSSILVDLAVGASVVALVAILGGRLREAHGRSAIAVAMFHPLASLCLFYSLTVHMYHRLGGWPSTIGDRGFPHGLVVHVDLAMHAFGSLILGALLVWPIAVLFCFCVPRMRSGLLYLSIYALGGVAVLGAMQLAPDPFLYWWWD